MIKMALRFAAGLTFLLLVAGFLGFLHPALDTLANFRWHFAIILLGLAILLAFYRRYLSTVLYLLAAGFGIWTGTAKSTLLPIPTDNPKPYTLMQFNLKFDNAERSVAIDLIRRTDADILSLNETSTVWERDLKPLQDTWPYQFHCPEWSNIGGVMIFSKYPIILDKQYCHDYAALGLVQIEFPEATIEVGSVHLRWPWPASGPRQITALGPRLVQLAPDAIIAGDFNSASWTHSMKRFAEFGSLNLVQTIGGTWIFSAFPASWAKWVGLPIDHILVKGRVRVVETQTFPPAGSDHLPILLHFELQQ